jgi:hypothetical protein
MYYVVLLVLHDVSRLEEILTAWEGAGVSGITVLATTGLGRIRQRAVLREDLPLMPSLEDLLSGQHEEYLNRSLFSIVEGEELVDRLVAATERVLGDLNQPRNGIIVVLPAARVYGLRPPYRAVDSQ